MDSSGENYDWLDVVCTEDNNSDYPISFICQKPYIDIETTTTFITTTTRGTITPITEGTTRTATTMATTTKNIKTTTITATSTQDFTTTPDLGRYIKI